MKHRLTKLFISSLVLLSIVSCDKNYDFNKLDKTMAVGANLDIPLKMLDSISLKNYMKVDLGKISFDADDIEFTVPAIPDPSLIPYPQIEEDVASINEMKLIRHYGEPDNFPKWIKELKTIRCDCDSTVYDVTFDLPDNPLTDTVYFKEGLTINYPEWVHINKCSDPYFKIADEGHTIVLQESIALVAGEIFGVQVHLDSLILPEGAITSEGLEVTGILEVDGVAFIKKSDVHATQSATDIKIGVNGTLSSFKVVNASLRIYPEEFNPSPITFDGLSIDNLNFSMMDATVFGKVLNPLELSFNISAAIEPEGFKKPKDVVSKKKSLSEVSFTLEKENGETFNKVTKISFTLSIVDYKNELVTICPDDKVYFTVEYMHTDNGVFIDKKKN